MTNIFDEENYRLNKSLKLKNLFKELDIEPEFVWVGAGSRRRVAFQVDGKNNLGFYQEKSHILQEIDEYKIAEEEINLLIKPLKDLLKILSQNLVSQIIITSFDNGLDLVLRCNKTPNHSDEIKFINFAKNYNLNCSYQIKHDLVPLYLARNNLIFCQDFKLKVASNIFLQATRTGLETIVSFLKEAIYSQQNLKKIADLYCGCGIYSFSLFKSNYCFDCFEGDATMVNNIKNNAKDFQLFHQIKANIRDLYSDPLTPKELNFYDNIIINPPRNGAEPQIKNIALSAVKNLQYISCNPQSFLRDARILIDSKFVISRIVALDQFYSTNHYEILANFIRKPN